MNKTNAEAAEFVSKLIGQIKTQDKFEVIVCPPFTALEKVRDITSTSSIKVGAQNVYYEDKGAYTGEISVNMLKDIGVEYVILGHSERRHIFQESDELINKKLKKVLASGLKPILCVGEQLEEREKGLTFNVVERQIKEALYGLTEEESKKIIIAYEPVWAIGTGKVATPNQAQEVHKFIRDLLKDIFNEEFAKKTTILYGGSIKPNNYLGLFGKPDIDGGLVGGASLTQEFVELANIMKEIIE
ncbi:triosephosphate isomerase [Petrotoga sp. 8T1HF07.NaAc.6.1]|nr:triose-phosphate isomerase [Petrotoga sp. 8T1HF07.NaAc.6.1]MBL5981470.1 triosephosphate isomerase [Petrotoga sp. 8T1HF07.NaAc.6.1]